MSDDNKIVVKFDFFWPCVVIMMILFSGEPDLLTVVIHYIVRITP